MILGEAFHRRVVQQIVEHLTHKERHAALFFDPTNVRYVTGLSLTETDRPVAVCIWQSGDTALFVPHLEAEHVVSSWIRDIRWYAEFPAEEHPARWMAREAGGSLFLDNVDVRLYREILEEQEETEITDVVEKLRARKTSTEVDLIEQAAGFADRALELAFARLTSGVTEHELLRETCDRTESEILTALGSQYDDARPTIDGRVLGGTHAALPQAHSSSRQLNRGDLVIIEFVVTVGGYHAAAGSTFFVGDPLRDIVSTVASGLQAQETLRNALQAGTTGDAISQEVRRSLERAGLGNAMRHRPGHGTGLQLHEAPWLVRGAADEIKDGMVVINQPGIYLSGRTGIRHTETVLVERNGARVLNPTIRRWDDPEDRLKEF